MKIKSALSTAFSRAAWQNRLEDAKTLLVETPAEIYIGIAAGAFLGSVWSYANEADKRGQISLGFSEISQSVLYVEKVGGKKIEPLTRYYASLNDVAMQVFEANNLSYTMWGGGTEKFAYELEKKVEVTFRIHTLISDYAKVLPTYAADAQRSLAPLAAVDRDIRPVIQALDKAWDEDHDDVYRTEFYTTTSCDKDGCTTQTHSRQVYDYTIHTYTYDAAQGRLAARLLSDFAAKYPHIGIDEKLLMTWQTNAENEWAMRQSRKRELGYKNPTQDQYIEWANKWATGSNYNVHAPKAYAAHGKLMPMAPAWQAQSRTAQSDRYRTGFRSDSGPAEFQTAEAALDYAVQVSRNISTITGGVQHAHQAVPALEKKIWQFVNATLHGGEGNPNALRKDVMHMAREIYKKNYSEGFDTHPAKWGMVVLWGVLGALAGGGIGFGADRLIDRSAMARRKRYRFIN